MKKSFPILISLIFSLSIYASNTNISFLESYVNTIDAIGKQEIHLERLLLQITKVQNQEDLPNTIDRELVYFEENLKTTNDFVLDFEYATIKKQFENTKAAYKKLQKLLSKSKINYTKSSLQKEIISSHLDSLKSAIEYQMIDSFASYSFSDYRVVSNLMNNVKEINNQLAGLKSYELNNVLNKQNFSDTATNIEISQKINKGINYLILNNLNDLSYDDTLTTIIKLNKNITDHNQNTVSVISDISLLFKELKDKSLKSLRENFSELQEYADQNKTDFKLFTKG